MKKDKNKDQKEWIPHPPEQWEIPKIIEEERFEAVGQLDRSASGWRPLPPFLTGENREFSFEITRFIQEAIGKIAFVVLLAKPDVSNIRFKVFRLLPQLQNRNTLGLEGVTESININLDLEGKPIERSDPIIAAYTPVSYTHLTLPTKA